ncbi:hypothetical protein RRSWK_06990 [Rhodopirellula sp. SWK7]|nr:hypothetical protein RRSWK_06990 [Rhodopirellula sp. SWK7]
MTIIEWKPITVGIHRSILAWFSHRVIGKTLQVQSFPPRACSKRSP